MIIVDFAQGMEAHTLAQGSPEWHAHRLEHYNASDAPAMMGVSDNKSRTALLDELATGLGPEFSSYVQERVLDKGHEFERLARPLAEQQLGEDLYPVVGSRGKLSASFDGLTMLEDRGWEHKRLNAALREAMKPGCTGEDLPMKHQVQMEHQCIVSGCERVLFMASEWEGDRLIEERHCWYEPNPQLAARIIAGWAQLEQDLRTHVVRPVEVKPEGKAPETLPALRIEVTGAVTASNLVEFKETALAAIRSVNRELSTDLDFANADKAVKWCGEVESRLAAAKEHALSQTASIDELFKAIDDISAEARRMRLDLTKLVDARKVTIRQEIVANAQAELDAHVAGLNGRLGQPWVPRRAGGFAEAMKGKRTIETLRDAASTLLAALKIDLSALADRLEVNRAALRREDRDWFSLFSDFATAGAKPADDFAAIAELRITKQLADEAAAAERRRAAEEAAAATPPAPAPDAPKAAPAAGYVRHTLPERRAPEPKPVPEDAPPVKLGDINKRLGFPLTAAFVEDTLGIAPASRERGSFQIAAADMHRLFDALTLHIERVAAEA